MIFGTHESSFTINEHGIQISVASSKSGKTYHRDFLGSTVKKAIIGTNAAVIINPVEPTQLPKPLTPFIQIELAEPILVEPGSNKKLFLTIPIEIGVFLEHTKKPRLLDVISLSPKKLTLYGEPSNGLICQYCKSEVFETEPETDCLTCAILSVEILNAHTDWVELTQMVFNTQGMRICFNEEKNVASGKIKIRDDGIAETILVEPQSRDCKQKSVEMNKISKIRFTSQNYLMEFGL